LKNNLLTYVGDHVFRVTYTTGHIDTVDSPDDKHLVAQNM